MRQTTQAPVQQNNEVLSVVFEKFNQVFRAIISDENGKRTFAYGKTKSIAEINAKHNFQRKYYTVFHVL